MECDERAGGRGHGRERRELQESVKREHTPFIRAQFLFASQLEPAWFDLVHARFQLAPLGRGQQQTATYLRLVRPGGTIVLEEVDPPPGLHPARARVRSAQAPG